LHNRTRENNNLSIPGSTPSINLFASGVYDKHKRVFPDNGSDLAAARINTDFKIPGHRKIGEQFTVWKRNTTPVKTEIVSTSFRNVPAKSPYSGNPDAPWGGFPGYLHSHNRAKGAKVFKKDVMKRDLSLTCFPDVLYASKEYNVSPIATPPAVTGVALYQPSTVLKSNSKKVFAPMVPWFQTKAINNGSSGICCDVSTQNAGITIYSKLKHQAASYLYPLVGPYARGDTPM